MFVFFRSIGNKMESFNEEKFGGYNVHFINELSDEYVCPVCKKALREPIQTECGHRLCLSCSKEIKKRNEGVLICPLEKSMSICEKTFPDRAIERVIMQLNVKCSNFCHGCEWTGELKTLNVHEESCEWVPLDCVNQCGMKILPKKMTSHITESCTNTEIPCQYLNIGCNFKGRRKEQETHSNFLLQNHLSMTISKVVALENNIRSIMDVLENKVTSTVNEIENKVTSSVDELKNEIILKMDFYNDKIKLHEKNLEVIRTYLAIEKTKNRPFHNFYQFCETYQSIRNTKHPLSQNLLSLEEGYNDDFEKMRNAIQMLYLEWRYRKGTISRISK